MAGATTPRVAVAGVGYSTIGRRTGLSAAQLTAQCVRAALDDAGLQAGDIDGYSTLGGEALADAAMLGMEPLSFFYTGGVSPAYVHPAMMAVAAITSGFAHTVVSTRIIQQQPSTSQRMEAPNQGIGGDAQFMVPFGGGMPPQWAGLMTRRRMEEFSETEEMYAAQVVAQRAMAAMNPDALLRDPITVEDYFNSRLIAEPVRLLNCDYPCDSGSAVIYTTEERARDLRHRPVLVESYALTAIRELNFEMLPDMVRTAPAECSRQLWERSDLGPADVDCAQLYDGFTFITFEWLEALGLCEPGGAGQFALDGHTALGGSMPTNTDGGACNVGRRHGANFCIEATRQLRGDAGPRQVPGADVAVWSNAVGPFAGAMVLVGD